MNAQELWNKYKKINPSIGDVIDAWQFGLEADLLAKLVLEGTKTATASAYDLYAVDNDPLPEVGFYDVILDSKDQAVCIIQIKKSLLYLLRKSRRSMLLKKVRVINRLLTGEMFTKHFSNPILKNVG